MSLRAFRFAVLSSVVLCASRALAQDVAGAGNDAAASPSSAETVTPPRLLHAEPATIPDGESPAEAVAVTLALTVDETGHVADATILESGGDAFDRSALTAVQAFAFEPARRGETKLAAKIRYRYVFPAAPAPASVATEPEPEPTPERATAAVPVRAAAPALEAEAFSAVATIEAPAREATKRTVSGEMLSEMPGTRGDALRAIEVMPGVGRTSLNNGDPILRGAGQDESQTYLNGVPVPFLYHFGGLTSFFSSRYVERIDLYPGNFSTRYGRVSGGVIEVRSKDPRTDGLHAGFDLNLVDSSAFVSSNVGSKASFALAARRSNIDLVFAKLVPKDTYSVVAAPVYYDYQAIGAYHVNARHTLRVLGYGSRDSLQLLFSNPNDDDPSLSGNIAGTLAFHRVQVELDSNLSGRHAPEPEPDRRAPERQPADRRIRADYLWHGAACAKRVARRVLARAERHRGRRLLRPVLGWPLLRSCPGSIRRQPERRQLDPDAAQRVTRGADAERGPSGVLTSSSASAPRAGC